MGVLDILQNTVTKIPTKTQVLSSLDKPKSFSPGSQYSGGKFENSMIFTALSKFAPIKRLAGIDPANSAKKDLENYMRGKAYVESSGKSDTTGGFAKNIITFDKINPQTEYRRVGEALKTAENLQNISIGAINETGPIRDISGKYKTINEGGVIKSVEGKPIKIVDGVETFIHPGDNPKRTIKGFVVSEKSTGRYLASGETEREAITNAKNAIRDAGEENFKKLIAENQLAQPSSKGVGASETYGRIKFDNSISDKKEFIRRTLKAKSGSFKFTEAEIDAAISDIRKLKEMQKRSKNFADAFEYAKTRYNEFLPNNLDTIGNGVTAQTGRKLSQSVDQAIPETGLGARKIAPQILEDAGQSAIPKSASFAPKLAPLDDSVNKIIRALDESKPLRGTQEGLYAAERSKRIGQVISIGKNVPGEKGYFAQLSKLKGELPKVNFESVRPQVTQVEIDSLFNKVEQSPLLPFEKISAKGGLAKILGEGGGAVPTKGEISLLSEVFPKEFIDAVLKKRPLMQRLMANVAEVINIPRAIMASADFSAPMRQGIFFIGRVKQFGSAFANMFRYGFSEKAFQGLVNDIKARPSYPLMRESRLAITTTDAVNLSAREEVFMGNFVEKIPLFGKLARGSNRAYTGFLNKLRADVFDDLLKKASDAGIPQTQQMTDDLAKFINSATGRGTLPKLVNNAAPLLNGIFFSPRLIASRINLLNPVYYARLDPFVRKEALKSLLAFGAISGTVLTLAKLGGAEIETDPRSADFAKIKNGNTRYDILGGFQQYIRIISQLATGKVISSTTGREITLGEGYKPLTRPAILARFFNSKMSPIFSFALDLGRGQTATGAPVDVPNEVISRFIPLVAQDMYDLYQENGLYGLVEGLPAPFGVGTQTYGKTEVVSGQNEIGMPKTEIRQVPGLSNTISENLFGLPPVQTSKSYDIESYYDQLLALPKEDARIQFERLVRDNPELAKKITKVAQERKEGITPHDKDLKSKGVENGDRAVVIMKDFDKLKTKEEKAALWKEYVRKKIITNDVAEQLSQILK